MSDHRISIETGPGLAQREQPWWLDRRELSTAGAVADQRASASAFARWRARLADSVVRLQLGPPVGPAP